MNFYRKNIRHTRGDTYSIGFVSSEELDNVYFTCRDGLNDDSELLFQKKLGDGITLTEITEGEYPYEYAVRVAPEDTRNIQAGTYYYDMQININEDVFTIMKGQFIIEQDSTWEDE